MRYYFALIFLMLGRATLAQDWEDHRLFNESAGGTVLRIVSSTDTDLFASHIETFIAQNPTISIEYFVTGTSDVDKRVRAAPRAFDIAISSAMDLQLKLVNDGFALSLKGVSHPPWAQWRHSLFAFTSEPAAIVFNRSAFAGLPLPQSRQELIEALRARPEVFRGRIGTYDVRKSGLGYLFATQDARASETYWRLMEVMGALDARLYCCSGDMIDDLTNGTIAVAYNVLSSYAAARVASQNTLEIVYPADFPTTMMRTAFVSKNTPAPDAARNFIRHLIALSSNSASGPPSLPALNLRETGTGRATIALEPALMTFLDSLKRSKFLSEWEDALIQN